MLSRTEIAEQVWDMNFDSATNVIDVAIRRLRGKLDAPFERTLLHTVRGMGYVLEAARRMSRSRIGSLGRRLSYWLALQSLAGLVVVCAGGLRRHAPGFRRPASRKNCVQKQAQLRHLLAESTHDGDVATLKHKLDDFFIGHPDMALSLDARRWIGVLSAAGIAADRRCARRAIRIACPGARARDRSMPILTLDIRDDAALLRRIGFTLAGRRARRHAARVGRRLPARAPWPAARCATSWTRPGGSRPTRCIDGWMAPRSRRNSSR